MVPAENKAKSLSSVKHTTEIIHQFIIKKSDDYEKCIKVKLDSDDKLTLNKKKKKFVMAIVVRAIFL